MLRILNPKGVSRVAMSAAASLAIVAGMASAADYLVKDQDAYKRALKIVEPGDRIVLADGVWKDFQIVFEADGEADNPITLMAQTPGQVVLSGQSNLRIGGEHLVVWGLTFRDGYSPTSEVISFRRDSKTFAHNSRLVETVIDGFSNPDRDTTDNWVVLHGTNNRVDRNAFFGKTNKGPTLVVRLNSPESEENGHRIERNYFGERAPLGGNGGETLRVGVSQTSRVKSNTIIRQNLFERCDGEVEIISIKSEGNLVTENTFYESRGSVVFRHGGHNEVSRNVFIGNGVADTGGIRVINDNQTVRDNYLEGLRGQKFLGALVVMNGVPNSPENRYHQVDNALIENNSFVDIAHIGLGVGSDEERSAQPINSAIRDNILLSDEKAPIGVFDDIGGFEFSGNVSNNRAFELFGATVVDGDEIERADNGLKYLAGADVGAPGDLRIIDRDAVGPRHFVKPSLDPVEGQTIDVQPGAAQLIDAIKTAKSGDTLQLSAGVYDMDEPIFLNKHIHFVGAQLDGEATTTILGPTGNSLFELSAGGGLHLHDLAVVQRSASSALIFGVGEIYKGDYDLTLDNVTAMASDADASAPLLAAQKATFARSIEIDGLEISDWPGAVIDLSGEGLEGWYLTDDLMIRNSSFSAIGGTLVAFGRDGRDESTFGPRFLMTDTSLMGVGSGNPALHLEGIDQLTLRTNDFDGTGDIVVKRRVLGMPFDIGSNSSSGDVSIEIRNVDDTPLTADLQKGLSE